MCGVEMFIVRMKFVLILLFGWNNGVGVVIIWVICNIYNLYDGNFMILWNFVLLV